MRFSEPGMHTRGHASDAAWSRHMRRLADQLASAPPEPEDTRSRKERMIQKGQGHPDRADVRAAVTVALEERISPEEFDSFFAAIDA